jgi:hypothetical protein
MCNVKNLLICLNAAVMGLMAMAVAASEALPEFDTSQTFVEQGIYYSKDTGQPITGVLRDKDSERQLRHGQFHGDSRFFWPNGKLKQLVEFSNNAAHGSVKSFYANGQLAYHGRRWQGRETGEKVLCYTPQGEPLIPCSKYAMTAGEHGVAPE